MWTRSQSQTCLSNYAQAEVFKSVCMHACVLNCFSPVQLFATLRTLDHQAPLSMEFFRQEYQSGLPFPSPGDLPKPGIEIGSPALQADSKLYQGLSQIFFCSCVHVTAPYWNAFSGHEPYKRSPSSQTWIRAHPCPGAALSPRCSGPREPSQLSQSFDVRSPSALWVGEGRNVNKRLQ